MQIWNSPWMPFQGRGHSWWGTSCLQQQALEVESYPWNWHSSLQLNRAAEGEGEGVRMCVCGVCVCNVCCMYVWVCVACMVFEPVNLVCGVCGICMCMLYMQGIRVCGAYVCGVLCWYMCGRYGVCGVCVLREGRIRGISQGSQSWKILPSLLCASPRIVAKSTEMN